MSFERSVYISCIEPNLLNSNRKNLQKQILAKIKDANWHREIFGYRGKAKGLPRSFQNTVDTMRNCDGVLVIDFSQSEERTTSGNIHTIRNEYAQMDAALATALGLPVLFLAEEGISEKGIIASGADHLFLFIPKDSGIDWLSTTTCVQRMDGWYMKMRARSDVFLGYSSESKNTADAIYNYLTNTHQIRVLDWQKHFEPAHNILDEIHRASKLCSRGIFLFMNDDQLGGDKYKAAPRDNVVFEAGFFAAAKGKNRVLIIREQDAKMPADLGGDIFLDLEDRNDISCITPKLDLFFGLKEKASKLDLH